MKTSIPRTVVPPQTGTRSGSCMTPGLANNPGSYASPRGPVPDDGACKAQGLLQVPVQIGSILGNIMGSSASNRVQLGVGLLLGYFHWNQPV